MNQGDGEKASRSDLWTVAAISVLAYVLTNVAHETIGHGAGLLVAGGRSGIFTTTRLIIPHRLPDPAWRLFDLGGPAGNLCCAGLAWLGLGLPMGARPALRLFLWLVMAFSLFWAFGYQVKCGVTGDGDWMALLPENARVGRLVLTVAGIVLYAATMRLTGRELGRMLCGSPPEARAGAERLVWIGWLAGGAIATAGAALDPRGPMEMLRSGALSSLASAVGLLRAPKLQGQSLEAASSQAPGGSFIIHRSKGWILAAAMVSAFFVGVLGRGIPWRL